MSSESITSAAVVLRRVAFGEADLIITLMTRELGKLSALARGARSSRRRFGSSLELGSLSSAELGSRRGGELWTLRGAISRRSFRLGEVAALAHGSYAAELVRELTAAEQPEPAVFDLLIALWTALEEVGPRAIVLRRFELALLGAVGLLPSLEACAACEEREVLARPVLDPARGVLCVGCAAHARGLGVRPMSDAARRSLVSAAMADSLIAEPLEEAADLAAEVRDLCAAIVAHHVGKPLKSLEFIAKVSAAAPRG